MTIKYSYAADRSATTTVTGQSEAVPAGASRVRIQNLDGTNYARVAFGTSASNAETNAATGHAVEFGQSVVLNVPDSQSYLAWLGNTGTVVLNVAYEF